MVDPFLRAHQAGPRFFDLSGKLIPVSIRDQMVRGRLLVDRAEQEKLIGPNASLLVIGGGACGATAAIRAAELGVRTILIDDAPDAFALQYGCNTRWIDPTQYDWPADHWDQGIYPWAGAPAPLNWSADWSNKVARRWRLALTAESQRLSSSLVVRFDSRLAWPPALHNHRLHVLLDIGGTPQQEIVAMIIVAVGAGEEVTRSHAGSPSPPAGTYRGFAFWQDDPLQQTHSGVAGGTDHVLISGSGDGALQDFLRIMTRTASAKEIYKACFFDPQGQPLAPTESIERAILGAETRARGAAHWGRGGSKFDHDFHQELEDEHREQVAIALKHKDIRDNLASVLKDRPDSMQLVHRCTHLTCSYALNRFLVLLIAEYLRDEHSLSVLEPKTSVNGVIGTHGGPCGVPTKCHGQQHDIELQDYPECWGTGGAPRTPLTGRNVVVIRHGIRPEDIPWLSLTPLANPRQVLPCYLH